jgi:hypothetical protein
MNHGRRQFRSQRHHAKQRGILFFLTFEEWCEIWNRSGHLFERGRGRGKFCMARFNDSGAYQVGNVKIITHETNTSECHKGKPKPLEQRRKMAAAAAMRCRDHWGKFAKILPAIVMALLMMQTFAFAQCQTQAEARAAFPHQRIYWHTSNHCWDNSRSGTGDYGASAKPVHQDLAPKKEPPSWIERAGPKAPEAAIYFPAMVKGNGLDAYPLLIWQQPWLVPISITSWPLLLDVDRVPFTAWTKRIGE